MDVQNVGKQTTLRKYAEARAGRPTEMTRDAELFMTCTGAMKIDGWQCNNLL